MLKRHYIIIFIVVVAAIAASFWLMPHGKEIALMEMKDKHFEEARASYEAEAAKGEVSLETAKQLSELYLQIGAVDKAIVVMEKYVAVHPDNLDARERLGTFYQYAERTDDYVRNLEEINKLKPDPENLKTLSDIYNFTNEYDRQVATLKEIIKAPGGNNAKNNMDLANLLASQKSYPEAIDILQKLKASDPKSFGFPQAELLVSLLLDQKQLEQATSVADDWKKGGGSDVEVARLVNMVHFKGNVEQAAKLMQGYTADQLTASADLMQEHVLILLDQGKDDQAYAELKALYDKKALTPELQQRLLFLASEHGEHELTASLLKSVDLNSLNETQLVALVELAAEQHDQMLLAGVTKVGNDDQHKDMLLLHAMLALANHNADVDARIAAINGIEFNTSQKLQIANACARAGNVKCANDYIAKLPAITELSVNDIAGVAEVYLDLHQYDAGYAYVQKAMPTHSGLPVEKSMAKFAAARGDDKTVYTWLDANEENISVRLLTDMYFLANNNKHYDLAADLAERAYKKEQTPTTRSLLADSLVKSGQFEKAVTLLRENKVMSETDENNYVFALAKLSKHQPAYRKELVDYATARFKSSISEKQKMTLLYALIDAHEMGPALPYIRQLALTRGGQWAQLYADTLEKQGRYAEARTFWLQIAAMPSTPASQKRSIAYTLLDHGYGKDAETIFMALAKNAGPKSDDVSALLYIWGPRLTQEQLAWLSDRMEKSNGKDKEAWASLIAENTSGDALIEFADAHPSSLQSPTIARNYFQALSDKGELDSRLANVMGDDKTPADTQVLKAYAQVAADNGNKESARAAYERLFALNPNDNITMREAGQLAYGQADYTAAKLYFAEYIKTYNSDMMADPEAYDVFYTYGTLLKREHKDKDAMPYFQEAIDLMDTKADNSADNASKYAQSLIAMGKADEGLKHFEVATTMYPNDDVLRADYISALVDLQCYDEARTQLAKLPVMSDDNAMTPLIGSDLTIAKSSYTHYELANNDSELLIERSHPDERHPLFSDAQVKTVPGVAYTTSGYQKVLVVAQDGQKIIVDNNDGVLTITTAADQSANNKLLAQSKLRYELLAARVDLETGHMYAATNRLAKIHDQYQNDPQYLGFAANAENYSGNWEEASTLLAKAHAIAPHNEDVADLNHEIRRLYAPGVKLDEEFVARGHNSEYVTTASGFVNATDHLIIGADVSEDHARGKNVRLDDGRVGTFTENKEWGDIYATYHERNGLKLTGTFYANNDTPGAGLAVDFLNPLGATQVAAEYHRPNSDYTESVLDDATRDRIGFTHTIHPTTLWTLSLSPNFNRYNTEYTDDVAESASVDFSATYRLRNAQPSILLGYGLNAEYLTKSRKKSIDSNGGYTALYPLVSREIHSISADMAYNFDDADYGELIVGYAIDRLGGSGPLLEGRLTHEFNKRWDMQLRASYGLEGSNSNDQESRIGVYLRYKFN